MPSTVPADLGTVLLHSLKVGCALLPGVIVLAGGFDLDAALDKALGTVGMKRETFAGLLGVSAARLGQITHHDGRLSLQALTAAAQDEDGRKVVAALVQEWTTALGIVDTDAVAARLAELTTVVRGRMAKATLRDTHTTRRTA